MDPHHPEPSRPSSQGSDYPPEEETQEFWKSQAQLSLREVIDQKPILKQAKNVIIFMGDGMGISTLTAARILKGKTMGLAGGEQAKLSFEEFTNVALSRTYCVDSTVADSACSATAYLGGVKGNRATIGVTAAVKYKECEGQLDPENQVTSIISWAQEEGMATGVVTTNRITDASPAGAYAHVAYRGWENDADVEGDGEDSDICDDIAEQLVRGKTGQGLDLVLGGGRREFQPPTIEDPEDGSHGDRGDGVDLIKEWEESCTARNLSHIYITSGKELNEMEDFNVDRILGLFSSSHMEYHIDQTPEQDDPTLEDMTRATIKVLSSKPNGYVAFIEGGLIDHGHHGNKARVALDETLELDLAVTAAVEMVDLEETLIIVTADHSHAMTINGYPDRGNDIFGFGGHGHDGLYYPTLMYGTGPGYKEPDADGGRYDISHDDMSDPDYRFVAAAPETSSDHAGEEVVIYAIGPHAHLFRGLRQQNYIPHALAYAACIGEGLTFCDNNI